MAEKKPYFVHESAYVHDDADIGNGTSIWHFTHIRERVRIGENRTDLWTVEPRNLQ